MNPNNWKPKIEKPELEIWSLLLIPVYRTAYLIKPQGEATLQSQLIELYLKRKSIVFLVLRNHFKSHVVSEKYAYSTLN